MRCGLAIFITLIVTQFIQAEPERFRYTRPCMGTLFTIEIYGESKEAVEPAVTKAWALADRLDNLFSDYKPNSELSKLSREGRLDSASADLREILQLSKHLHEKTEGSFDISLGPMQRLWKISRRDDRQPTDEAIMKAKAQIGMEGLKIDGETVTLEKKRSLDLGGIGKGYSAQKMVELLKQEGFPMVLVAASGDVVLGSPPPSKKGWTVGLVSLASPKKADKVLVLSNCAVSTSGDFAQYFEHEGERYSHIVNPETGLGMRQRRCVSVISPHGYLSDAMATAISVKGIEGSPWLKSFKELSARETFSKDEAMSELSVGSHFETSDQP